MVKQRFTPRAISNSMMPKAMAKENSPSFVYNIIAVVRVRVKPNRFPPTIMTAPTSEMAPPKPAITPVIIPRRASLRIILASQRGVAERETSVSRIFGLMLWIEEMLMPQIIGRTSINWAITMAEGVYRSLRKPSGPAADKKR
jgi:hypothetical protein